MKLTMDEIEEKVSNWHLALFGDLIAGRILPLQFVAGLQIANEWGLERYVDMFAPETETDLCVTTSF